MRSKNWLQRQNADIYVKKAKKEGYPSRSAFKLIEIENKFKIISKSKLILELGSAPGGWSQVLCEKNKRAFIYSFDLNHMEYHNKQIKASSFVWGEAPEAFLCISERVRPLSKTHRSRKANQSG